MCEIIEKEGRKFLRGNDGQEMLISGAPSIPIFDGLKNGKLYREWRGRSLMKKSTRDAMTCEEG